MLDDLNKTRTWPEMGGKKERKNSTTDVARKMPGLFIM